VRAPPALAFPPKALTRTRRRIIYPHTHADFVRAGRTEADLMQILEHGWRAVREWRDVLSGGEKQRMGLARVFYHAPRFAVLDGA
jgi:ATP-binding cassette subfamily D (ALD) long-chain fatty acid import protein